MQKAKFAIILINRGKMDEFTSRDNMTLEIPATEYISIKGVDAVTASFEVVQTEVSI